LSSKYPELEVQYANAVKIAWIYDIDLSDANQKERDGNKFGAQPNDINLDICCLLSDWIKIPHYFIEETLNHLTKELINWGYEYNEISESFAEIRGLNV